MKASYVAYLTIGCIMNGFKRYLLFILLLVIAVLGIRKAYRSFVQRSTKIPIVPEKTTIQNRSYGQQTKERWAHDADYDFDRMLMLVDKAKETKGMFFQQYSNPQENIHLDKKTTEALLAELYREKLRLERYMWKVKLYYRDVTPRKRYRSILYYQKVIDKSIGDIELIVRNL